MILIEEKITRKCPGETSLFVTFPYRAECVEVMKRCSGGTFNKKDKVWEVPVTYLSMLLDEFCALDSIELRLIQTEVLHKKEPLPLQGSFKAKPFDHQLEAIQYGLMHDKWLMLLDPGLGKTLVAMYIAQELKLRGEINHCLIICGLNVLKTNWRREIEKFTDLSCTILGERINSRGRRVIGTIPERAAHLQRGIEEFFTITNIETLRDERVQQAFKKSSTKFDMIVVDEIHVLRSSESQQFKGLMKLPDAKYKIGATGTLIVSKPLDAYAPLKWLGIERGTWTNFRYYYGVYGGPFNNILCGFKNMDVLKDIIDKYSLRKTKDILNLPPKVQIDEYLDMEDRQARFYENIKQGVREECDKIELKTKSLLALLGRLRQATSCPSVLTSESIPTAKLDRTADLVEQIRSNQEKVVIFSSYKETVQVLGEMLKDYKPLLCTGDTKDDLIEQAKERFQTDPEFGVFIATWQKMGTGLTLTAASHVIFVDSPYTAAQKEQAEDRCHRIGTSDTVFIHNLITADTVDERVAEIVKNKEAISDYLIDGEVTAVQLQLLKEYIAEL